MATIECPVCGMTYTGKQCPICGAKVKIRYRDRGQAAQAAPAPEPHVYEEPQSTAAPMSNFQKKTAKSKPNRAAIGVVMAVTVIIASSFAGLIGSNHQARHRYEESQYVFDYTADPTMTDYEIEPQTIYDANGVKVVIEHFRTNDYMTEIHVHLYNENDYPVRVSSELATIDGVASQEWIYTRVEAHEEADDVLNIFDSNLEEIGLEAVHEFAFRIRLLNDDTYEDLDRSERIVFQSPIQGSAQHAVPDGEVVYEANGVRVTQIETRVEEGRFVMRYYLENDSGKDLTVLNSDNLWVNGEEVESSYIYGPEVPAGSTGYFEAVVFDYSGAFEDVSGTVFIKEFETWNDIGQFEIEY